MFSLKDSCLLKLSDLSYLELVYILKLASCLKKDNPIAKGNKILYDKKVALIFEKDSTRTRCSFEVASFDYGANITYLGPFGNQITHKESIKDSACFLSRIYDAIEYRGHKHKAIKVLSKHSIVPVINGLTDSFHPTQLLADLLTIKEYYSYYMFSKVRIVYIGDVRNNVCNSILEASLLTGLTIYLLALRTSWSLKFYIYKSQLLSQKAGGNVFITEDARVGINSINYIYTDVWVSMGESKTLWKRRIFYMRSYQVNILLLLRANNINVKFLHCLPAFHDNKTTIGKHIQKAYSYIYGMEVSNEAFYSIYSLVFGQAVNRMFAIKSLLASIGLY
ncbi:ornithine carbamoyltransferase [Candidatus Tremblaya phenacola]|uniref:Ornithine carbamoyltransferase n=1 Tax=Candidatus Tremblayella phenacoccinincola TaxID=1010676 RepID=A0A2G0V738_9PROT|nr:ornithine carbamoyltransferase [Candidatus Tremblaya phenacola]PHN16278.1 Ornithine carbamoyltransferase chain F [Candidatus Tremblaya phenacola]